MSEDKGRKRPHTLLQESSSTRQPRPAKDNQLKSDNGTLTIDPVVVVEADQSLRQLPREVRDQIDQYLQQPNANPKTLVASMKQFTLHTTAKGQSCCFVEMGTTNVLDAATYQCGPILHRGLITVIKPRPGSTFNGGNAAVIHYYGKGGKTDGRNISSRWSLWTPDGIKVDLLVDRMVTGEAPDEDDDDVVSPTPKRKKRKLFRKTRTSHKDVTGEDEDAASGGEGDDTIEVRRTTKPYREGSNLFVSEADDQPYQQGFVAKSPAPHRQPFPVYQSPWGVTSGTPATRMSSSHADTISMTNSSMSYHQGSVSRNTPHPSINSPTTNQTTIHFQKFDGETHLSKTLTQCDSVDKLFAYAFKAGVSGPDLMMLTASIGNFTVDIIRGDHDDFAELLRAIQDEQMVIGEEAAVRVFVTSVAY